MRVLLIGKGAREHALAWKLSSTSEHVFVAPGNGGTATMAENVTNMPASLENLPALAALAKELKVDLVVPGPDDVVVGGIADLLEAENIPCCAPSRAAAELEGSKTFAKEFMHRHAIPTAEFRCFDSYEKAKAYLQLVDHRVVIKVSGLAAGKGVVLPESTQEAQHELHQIMVDQKFGPVGSSVVIEEFLEGDEISILTFSDGLTYKSLPPGQDHKTIFDGSNGPNTGGMGVYGPTDFVSTQMMQEIERDILEPTFQGLKQDGRFFKGILFTGIMLTVRGPKVLEYNVRFGDPEAQSLVPLMSPSTDLARICLSCTNGTLDVTPFDIQAGSYACNVVVASAGYPGDPIEIMPCPADINIFHAGTEIVDGKLLTAGGRVFSVSAVRQILSEAVKAAYEGVSCIKFSGTYFRRDIAHRGLTY